jgi:predicted O-methyltransferase YrrM
MKPVTDDLLERINAYVEDLFAPLDPVLDRNLEAADRAKLPAINVSAAQGKLLYLLARIAGARRVLEVGTLGGFSTTWLARAVPPGGTVVTLEVDQKHADVARHSLKGAAPGVEIDLRLGDATESLQHMIAHHEPPFDFVFIDADKPRYVAYLELTLQLSRPGTVIVADNVVRHGLILEAETDDSNARAAREFNATIAAHPRLESVVLPLLRDSIDGISLSIVR